MNNKTSTLIITLTILGLISAIILSFVYLWTMPKINEHQAKAQEEAVFAVLPGTVEYKEVVKDGIVFFEGYDESNNLIGVAMVIEGGGFQGQIKLMIGTNPILEKIFGIQILNHQETPGLGARISEEDYRDNFADKPFGDYKVVKRPVSNDYEVEAISGATISSTKVSDIVEKALQDIQHYYNGGGA